MKRLINKLICKVIRHNYNGNVHGYYNQPNFGAVCVRCDHQAETKREWDQRRGRM